MLGVGHAVALGRQLVPEPDERAHLAHLLDEPHARVDEERDPADALAEVVPRRPARARAPCRGRRSRCTARRPAPGAGVAPASCR